MPFPETITIGQLDPDGENLWDRLNREHCDKVGAGKCPFCGGVPHITGGGQYYWKVTCRSCHSSAVRAMRSNNAPKTFWYRFEMACGVVRHKLYVDEQETPYFVDDAKKAGIGHKTFGEPVGLFGAGMGDEIRCRDGSTYRIAAALGGFRNITFAKLRAEGLALA